MTGAGKAGPALLALSILWAMPARATDFCAGQDTSAVRCDPASSTSAPRPSAVLASRLTRECRNQLLRRYAELASTEDYLDPDVKARFGTGSHPTSGLRAQACFFESSDTTEDALIGDAAELLNTYNEEAVCLNVSARCAEMGGTVVTLGGARYCKRDGVILDPSCLIAGRRADDIVAAAGITQGKLSCLRNVAQPEVVRAVEALFTAADSAKPRHCCGACLSARPNCASSGNPSLCATTCRVGSYSVVEYTTQLMGDSIEGAPDRTLVGASACARSTEPMTANRQLAATLFHEYLHAAGLCTDTSHNDSATRSPHDAVYACERACFSVTSSGFSSMNTTNDCVACAGGRLNAVPNPSPRPPGTTHPERNPPPSVITGNFVTAVTGMSDWFDRGMTAPNPPGVPQACLDLYERDRRVPDRRALHDASSRYGSCLSSSSVTVNLGAPRAGDTETRSWSQPRDLIAAATACESRRDAFATACSGANLTSSDRLRDCCGNLASVMRTRNGLLQENRESCMTHAFNECPAAWACYYEGQQSYGYGGSEFPIPAEDRCTLGMRDFICRNRIRRYCAMRSPTASCVSAAFSACVSRYSNVACDAALPLPGTCDSTATTDLSRSGFPYETWVDGNPGAAFARVRESCTRLRSGRVGEDDHFPRGRDFMNW